MSEPYTAADVQLVAEALWQKLKDTDFPNLSGPPSDACFEDARAMLAALAEAGRLTPDDAGREWGIALADKEEGVWIAEDERDARGTPLGEGERVVWRSVIRGSWVEVDEDGTETSP